MTAFTKTLAVAGLFGAVSLTQPAPASAQSYSGAYGSAQYKHAGPNAGCQDARRDQQVAGALVGGLLGAVAGGLIADNNFTDDDDDDWRRRGYRDRHWVGWDDHSARGWRRGGRGHYGYRDWDDDNDGEVLAGVLIGGALGAFAGSELAGSGTSCETEWRYADVPRPTRSAYGPAWNGDPVYTGQQLSGAPPAGDSRFRDCELVWQETRLPDGRLVREQVEACRDGEIVYEPRTRYGDWGLED